jgi:N-acetylglucosamine-6-sulfatase
MPGRSPGQAPNRLARPRPVVAGAVLLAAATALALTVGHAAEPANAGKQQTRPNIVVLFTDDQETGSMRVMKTVNKEMKRKGVTMKHFYANFPLCCPSRATMLTGQYAHNHKVLSNQAPVGGYGVYNELHGDNNLAVWMQNAGYRTSYIGKFMNEYAEPDEYGTLPRDVPKGWDDWHVLAPSKAEYFGFTLNQNGNLHGRGQRNRDYSTDVFTEKARKFIRRNSPGPDPFFLMLGYSAPHGGGGGSPGRACNRAAEPARRHLGTLKDEKKGQLPSSFNEADVSDKPSPIAQRDPLTTGQIRDTLRKRRCAWESLLAVDESVGEILDQIKRNGEARNTYIFYLSDNGYMRGEHRVRNNKRYLYEVSARVPFIARGPGFARNAKSFDMATNADLVPTIAQLTGVAPGVVQDGESLVPTLRRPTFENGRAALLEAYAGDEIIGLRTTRYLYAEWDTEQLLPEIELYDNFADPYQLNNLARDPNYATVVADLGRQLDQLIDCAGPECRQHPTGRLDFDTSGVGKGDCALTPVIARVFSPNQGQISQVDFRVDRAFAGTDTEAPFEVALPDKLLRNALPKSAEVVAEANFDDGRRLGIPAKIKVCK